MKRPMLVILALFLLLVLVPGLSGCGKSGDSTRPAASKPQEGRYVDIPVGGVIMWWGAKDEIPPSFELCDGQSPTTEGAVLKGKKPDLRDRFVKGAQPDDGKITDLGTGGADQLDLSHTHGSSNLTAEIGTHDQPFLLSYKARGRGFKDATWELRADSARRATGGPNTATAIAGETDPALDKAVDNRPAFQEMFFIIRVK
ncbi:MAG: hypothetical protein AB1696_05200 [Planctomycetota bacterium]